MELRVGLVSNEKASLLIITLVLPNGRERPLGTNAESTFGDPIFPVMRLPPLPSTEDVEEREERRRIRHERSLCFNDLPENVHAVNKWPRDQQVASSKRQVQKSNSQRRQPCGRMMRTMKKNQSGR